MEAALFATRSEMTTRLAECEHQTWLPSWPPSEFCLLHFELFYLSDTYRLPQARDKET